MLCAAINCLEQCSEPETTKENKFIKPLIMADELQCRNRTKFLIDKIFNCALSAEIISLYFKTNCTVTVKCYKFSL